MYNAQAPSVETTPRDLAVISGMKVYAQKTLAESLAAVGYPVWDVNDSQAKTAFLATGPAVRAQVLYDQLIQYDKDAGKAGPAAQQPAPQAAAETPPAPAAKQPVSRGRKAAATTAAQQALPTPPPVVAPTAQSSNTGNGLDLSPLLGIIEAQHKTLQAIIDSLASLEARSQAIENNQMASIRVQHVELGLAYAVAKETLGGSGEPLISDSIEQANEVLAIAEAIGGKAQ